MIIRWVSWVLELILFLLGIVRSCCVGVDIGIGVKWRGDVELIMDNCSLGIIN